MKTFLLSILLFTFAAVVYAIDPFQIMIDYQKAAAKPLWPGFQPAAIPVAIYDGSRTLLFSHPKPPEGFVELQDHKGVWSYPGLYSAVRSNTSADITGISTATAMLSDQSRAALIIHEAFHVYQRAHHPSWSGNEVEFFVYPRENARVLGLQRLETESMRRALLAKDSACWAMEAIQYRRERYKLMQEGSVAYERGTELNEGLAQYVEYASAEKMMELPAAGFEADNVRIRLYETGQALATLLDRFDIDWKNKMEKEQTRSLDQLLEASFPQKAESSCGFSEAEKKDAMLRADKDVAVLDRKLDALRTDFFKDTSWKIVVLAGKEPLWPNGFDPWNTESLKGTEVLHSRWVKVGNSKASIEVLNFQALTEGVGPHPLFNGIQKITIRGLQQEPQIKQAEAKLILHFGQSHLELQNAQLKTDNHIVTIQLE